MKNTYKEYIELINQKNKPITSIEELISAMDLDLEIEETEQRLLELTELN